ncbi:MAG: tannase/feruloyl esterase family alpha/beta hydrolase [Caulobacterales bacterium]|nr:tannase/feruloyl esterase family alpha/beta hydrolase [Caulobacterales bacterium]
MPAAAAAAAFALALTGAGPRDCAAMAAAALLHDGRVVWAEVSDGACRIGAELAPTAGSRIGVQLWLPLARWSGRYVQLGTGGFAGTIPTPALAAEVARGNAVGVTDTGHVGEDGFDARWAAGRPEAVAGYGYRSIKVAADAARALTAAFYGRAPAWRYFVGCSNGGRQGLMAAQRYPDDWDGVLAGAPALDWTGQLSRFARIQQALRRPGAAIPVAKLPLIQAAARAGRRVPTCRGADARDCLTPGQQAALAHIARDFDPAYAATPGGWDTWIVNPDPAAQTQATFAEGFFRHMVQDRPDWRLEDLSAADLRRARALSPVLDAQAGLSRFRARGGKLVIYTGLADPVISPRPVIAYHQRAGGADFSRLYRIPGMPPRRCRPIRRTTSAPPSRPGWSTARRQGRSQPSGMSTATRPAASPSRP